MTIERTTYPKIFLFSIPLLVIITSIGLGLSSLLQTYPEIAIGITYDLALTAPLFYFILIRKRKIPNITVVPVFILGLILASYLLPEEQQQHLELLKTYVLPIAELGVLSFVIYKVKKTTALFKSKKKQEADFYNTLQKTMIDTVQSKKIGNYLAAEIGMFYYSLFAWIPKKRTSDQYTNYKDNGAIGLFGTLIFIVLSETYVVHILAMKWNPIVAWVLSISSIYFAIQLFGHLKAMLHRPSEILETSLLLKYGLFGNNLIDFSIIEKVVPCSNDIEEENKKVGKLTFLIEAHNIAIYFKSKQSISKLYGLETTCDILLLNIDAKSDFINRINAKLAEYSKS